MKLRNGACILLAFIIRIRQQAVCVKEKLQDISEKSSGVMRQIKHTEQTMESGSRGKRDR
jgi:hypothetical protein